MIAIPAPDHFTLSYPEFDALDLFLRKIEGLSSQRKLEQSDRLGCAGPLGCELKIGDGSRKKCGFLDAALVCNGVGNAGSRACFSFEDGFDVTGIVLNIGRHDEDVFDFRSVGSREVVDQIVP